MTETHDPATVIRNRESLTDHGNGAAREVLLDVAEAALEAVHPCRTVPDTLEREGDLLRITDRSPELVIDLGEFESVSIVGAGKGSVAVLEALAALVGEEVTGGIVAEKAGQERPVEGLSAVDVVGAGHPVPDGTSLEAGRAVLDIADAAGDDDLVFVIVTGGTSSQLVAPAGELALSDLAETTELLLRSGLGIDEVNAVRTHLSELKGGRLATRLAPATVVSLIVVDEVAGEPWGPTVGDETTPEDALQVLADSHLADRVPTAVRRHLERVRESGTSGTPTAAELSALDGYTVVLADARDACEAARDRAADLGYEPLILSTTVEGESREVATAFASIADEARRYGRPAEPPCLLISGGETTVTVSDADGEGGPNQEFALQFALETAGLSGVTTLAIDTDGTDGPTDVAGGLIDGTTVPRLESRGVDASAHLRRHDARVPLDRAADAVYTGETGTNVMDLRLTLIERVDAPLRNDTR